MAVLGLWLDPRPPSSPQLLDQDLQDQLLENLASWLIVKFVRSFAVRDGLVLVIQQAGWVLMLTRTTSGLDMMTQPWLLLRQAIL